MKTIYALFLLLCCTSSIQAQDTIFLKDNKVVTGQIEIIKVDVGSSGWGSPKISCNGEIYKLREFVSFKIGEGYYFNAAGKSIVFVKEVGRINATPFILRSFKNGVSYTTPVLAMQKRNSSAVVKFTHRRLKAMMADCPEALEKYKTYLATQRKVKFFWFDVYPEIEKIHEEVLKVIHWYNQHYTEVK